MLTKCRLQGPFYRQVALILWEWDSKHSVSGLGEFSLDSRWLGAKITDLTFEIAKRWLMAFSRLVIVMIVATQPIEEISMSMWYLTPCIMNPSRKPDAQLSRPVVLPQCHTFPSPVPFSTTPSVSVHKLCGTNELYLYITVSIHT